ncbi:GIY-YIG nuclease family protein [bacterium]|nr:GIY-YIG nuclease family protein [bacterium]
MKGVYFLLMRLERARVIRVGTREALFPAGYYVYTGSAQRNLEQRVARHARRRKPKRWHIDYLTAHARVIAVGIIPGAPREDEAAFADEWGALADFVPMRKFGASDSPSASHLAGFRRRAKIERSPLWRKAFVLAAA